MDRLEEIELLEGIIFEKLGVEINDYLSTNFRSIGNKRDYKIITLQELFKIMATLKGYEREYNKLINK